jgi:hypothetical protein
MKITSPADFDKLGYIGVVTELEPASGRFGPVCPPTFSAAKGSGATWADKLAITDAMTVPSRESGWSDVERDAAGRPRREPAVLINSVAAEARQLSHALFHDSGIAWGRIAVQPMDSDAVDAHMKNLKSVPETDTLRQVIRDNLAGHQYDSWTASHRFADAAIRYAKDPATGGQMWKSDGELRGKLLAIDPKRDADWLWCNAANALLFGFWLSITGNGVMPKWARSLSSEIFGYGVSLLKTGATKGSELGPISNTFKASVNSDGELCLDAQKKTSAKDPDKDSPSNFGLGQIPTSPDHSAVSCEVILRRSGVSLTHLRQIRSEKKQERAIVRAAAAAGMFALAVVSSRNVFLRSGTDLFPVSTKWTARTEDGATVDIETDVETARAVLHAAIDDLNAVGLPQSGDTNLTMSKELAGMFTDAIISAPKGDKN